MNEIQTFLFAGGGTGGHLFPGIAVAQELLAQAPQSRFVFCGSGRDVERRIVREYDFEHVSLPVQSLSSIRRNPVRFAWRNWRSVCIANKLIRTETPTAVIGLGGFASFPLVVAAAHRRVPVILLEQNVIPGRATRWLARLASHVCTSFPQTAMHLPSSCRCLETGNPVRPKIAELHNQLGESNPTRTLLILGGSQGALAVNDAVVSAVQELQIPFREWQIVHQTGEHQTDLIRQRYAEMGINAIVKPFFSDLCEWYQRAAIVVSRAGATTLAELACAGIPAVLIPYPHAAANHQFLNARHFAECGAAVVVEQTGNPTLAGQLAHLMADNRCRQQMQHAMRNLAVPNAAGAIVDLINQITTGRLLDAPTESAVHLRAG